MRSARYLSFSALILVTAAAATAPVAGCSSTGDDVEQPPGDDTGGSDAGRDGAPKTDGSSSVPDTGAGVDGAKADAGGGNDTGRPDAGDDDGGADAGVDAG